MYKDFPQRAVTALSIILAMILRHMDLIDSWMAQLVVAGALLFFAATTSYEHTRELLYRMAVLLATIAAITLDHFDMISFWVADIIIAGAVLVCFVLLPATSNRKPLLPPLVIIGGIIGVLVLHYLGALPDWIHDLLIVAAILVLLWIRQYHVEKSVVRQ